MENSKNSNYNELIQTLIAEFVATANSWGDAVSGYLKSPHSKSITIDDWNTFISLMQQTLYYVMATRRALSQLSKVGELLEEHVSITSLSVSDDGVLTVELGSGDKKGVSGALQRIRIDDELNWEYTVDGGVNWKSFGVRAVPYLKILENNNWAYSEDGQKWTDLGISAKSPPAVRGVDYWTDADKAEIQNYVKTVILNGKW